MKEKRNDIWSGIVFAVFAVFLYVGSYWIPPTTSDILGSRFFPRLIAGVIGFLALFQIAGAVSSGMGIQETEESTEQHTKRSSKALLLTTITLFLYYVLVLQIGFTITSIVYLMCQSAILMSKEDFKNMKKVLILALVSILVPIFINTIFWRVFSIALPVGKLF